MPRAEAFAGAQDRRQRLAHRVGAVDHLGRGIAQVAISAGLPLLAEIAQQVPPAALQRLGQPQQRVEPPVIRRAPLGRGEPLVDLRAAQADVVRAKQGQRFGGRPVAPRAADLLVIRLDRFRQVGMGDPADVGLVDPHAEGDRGHDDQAVLALEALLDRAAGLRLHPAVVGRRMPGLRQRRASVSVLARVAQ